MSDIGQAHAAFKRAEADANRPGLSGGRLEAARRQVAQARSKLDRVVGDAVSAMEKAGYRVTIQAPR